MVDKQQSLFEIQELSFDGNQQKIKNTKSHDVATKIVWQLYVDGASRGNPGPSGAGMYILKNGELFKKKGSYLGKRTNNEAEYLALLIGIALVKKEMNKHDTLHIFSDSQLLINQMNGVYRVKKAELLVLYTIGKKETSDLSVVFQHIMREYNTHADQAANDGIDKKGSLPLAFLHMMRLHNVSV